MEKNVEDEMWRQLGEEYAKLQEENDSVLSKVKSMVDDSFFEALIHFIEEQENSYGAFLYELVKKPTGKYFMEFWHKKLQGYYCEQWSVGDGGDSFEGYVYVKITKNNYIKIHFSC
jgi:hypothetical protein